MLLLFPKKEKEKRIKCMEKWSTKDEVGRTTPSNLVVGSITYCSLLVKRQHRKASFYCPACWLLFPHDHVATLPRMSTSSQDWYRLLDPILHRPFLFLIWTPHTLCLNCHRKRCRCRRTVKSFFSFLFLIGTVCVFGKRNCNWW